MPYIKSIDRTLSDLHAVVKDLLKLCILVTSALIYPIEPLCITAGPIIKLSTLVTVGVTRRPRGLQFLVGQLKMIIAKFDLRGLKLIIRRPIVHNRCQ